jgi:hypothetical protein
VFGNNIREQDREQELANHLQRGEHENEHHLSIEKIQNKSTVQMLKRKILGYLSIK